MRSQSGSQSRSPTFWVAMVMSMCTSTTLPATLRARPGSIATPRSWTDRHSGIMSIYGVFKSETDRNGTMYRNVAQFTPFTPTYWVFRAISGPFQGHFRAIPGPFQGHSRAISGPFQGHLNEKIRRPRQMQGGARQGREVVNNNTNTNTDTNTNIEQQHQHQRQHQHQH